MIKKSLTFGPKKSLENYFWTFSLNTGYWMLPTKIRVKNSRISTSDRNIYFDNFISKEEYVLFGMLHKFLFLWLSFNLIFWFIDSICFLWISKIRRRKTLNQIAFGRILCVLKFTQPRSCWLNMERGKKPLDWSLGILHALLGVCLGPSSKLLNISRQAAAKRIFLMLVPARPEFEYSKPLLLIICMQQDSPTNKIQASRRGI